MDQTTFGLTPSDAGPDVRPTVTRPVPFRSSVGADVRARPSAARARSRLSRGKESGSHGLALSLLVFVLCLGFLFAGPALVLRLMTSPVAAGDLPEAQVLPAGDASSAALGGTVVFQYGNYPNPSYTGMVDTYLNKWNPTKAPGGEPRLAIGQDGAYKALLNFDLTPAAIPNSATVLSARLGLYCFDRNLVGPLRIGAYEVVRPWTEVAASWQKATASTFWGVQGCEDMATDYSFTPVTTVTVNSEGEWHYWDVTAQVQDWVTNPSANKGFVLIGSDNQRINYYCSSEWALADQRPELIVDWSGSPPTPTPTASPTPTATSIGPTPTNTATRTPTPTATPVFPPVVVDEATSCYSDAPPGQWNTGTAGGYAGSYRYETTSWLTQTAVFSPCVTSPIPEDGYYEVQAHWSVHSARPSAVPYTVHYNGGTATVYVDESLDADGNVVADFDPSGWYPLGVWPFKAGTGASTGEYVELNSSSAGDTCADAVRWIRSTAPSVSGPPYTVTVSSDPTELPSDGVSTASICITVTDIYGNLVVDDTMIGITTSLGSVDYAYTEAESAGVTKLGTWPTALSGSASNGAYIYSDNPGDEVTWSFSGEAVSLIYPTNTTGGQADVIIDGSYVTTLNFASGSLQWLVERQLSVSLTPGPHIIRIQHAGSGRVWLDAFRSGTVSSGGIVCVPLTAPSSNGVAVVRATAIQAEVSGTSTGWPTGQTTVSFPGPLEVWVDDDYCSSCGNDGHIWNYTAYDTIQGGVNGVLANGTVHVLPGTYAESVTVAKRVSLLGSGASSVLVVGTDAAGSRGFYVDRADYVTISGFRIRDFETGIYLRGTGVGPGPRVLAATITNNVLESNTTYGVRGSYVFTSTICSNDVTLGNNGIYLENSSYNTVCYNTVYNNLGVGIRLNTGNQNSFDNNHIYDLQNVGIELSGSTLNNGIYGNHVHDVFWDGILVNGGGGASVTVGTNTIANTNQGWLDGYGAAPDANHNRGGLTLIGITSDSVVRLNRIAAASNAEGNRTNSAGVYLFDCSIPITVESNLIESNAGHGIYISSTLVVTAPLIHGNSIYSNALFGLNNQLITRTHAEGNWWGHNTVTVGPSTPRDVRSAASVWSSPPITVGLKAGPSTIPADGMATSAITATGQGGGYNILDGTLITFTSDLATVIYPTTAGFGGGKAYATLRAGTIAGVAIVGGVPDPGIAQYTTTVTLTAGAPASISVESWPLAIPNSCDTPRDRAVITATVEDAYGNPVPGVVVSFTSNALGSVFPSSNTTLAGTGTATTTFTSGGLSGTGIVSATVGGTLTAVASVEVTAGPVTTMTLSAAPTTLPANGVALSNLTVTMVDCLGNPIPDGELVGFTTTLGSIVNYAFVEAESSVVMTSTGWSGVNDPTASGGRYLNSTTPGAAASWVFRGEGVALRYRRFGSGGVMRVRIDAGAPIDVDTNGAGAWVERVIATGLSPYVDHVIEVTVQSATIRLDAFRSGPVSSGGQALAQLKAPALAILSPTETHTATVYATERIGHLPLTDLVVTTTVIFGQGDVVWVDDDWVGLPNGTVVTLPGYVGGGSASIGSDAFDTIPGGVQGVKTNGTVRVLAGTYPLPVVVTRTMHLVGDGSSSTFIQGAGSGTGVVVRRPGDGVTIDGFTIRDFGLGVYLDGRTANHIDGFQFVNNALINNATGAITATFVDKGYFADNEIYAGSGYGIDLYNGNTPSFIGNRFHDIGGFGLRTRSTTGALISHNSLQNLGWNGIVAGDSSSNTSVVSNIIDTTNLTLSGLGFNEGGIVLYNTTNSVVEYNKVFGVGTAGGSNDTAGLWIGGSDSGSSASYNQFLNNVNDGVLLWAFNVGAPPVLHCNHIYGNGRFGIRNQVAAPPIVDATGNWWGRNTPTTGTSAPRDIYRPPVNVDYDPRIRVLLAPSAPTVLAGGPSIVITATACGGGCCMLDGMPITLTTSLGQLGAPPGPVAVSALNGGWTIVAFKPGTVAGTAVITGYVANHGVVTTSVQILPLAPATISVTAAPNRIRVGETSVISAEVRDIYANPVSPGTPIYFDTTLGTLVPISSTVFGGGVATTTLHAGIIPGRAIVGAYSGFVADFADVQIIAGSPYTITSLTANPPSLRANGLDTSLITAIVLDQYGNLVPDLTMVGMTTTHGSLYRYVEAEAAEVISSTGWTAFPDGTASGGWYIRTATVAASVYWNFRGEAVSVVYYQDGVGGVMRVRIDGASPVDIDTNAIPGWREQVIAADLDPNVSHQLEIVCQSGVVRLDAFRAGAAVVGGQAKATLTASMLPPVNARIIATGIDIPGVARVVGTFPTRTLIVPFLQPKEVWVNPAYCDICPNDGHQWGYDAFSTIPPAITAVASWGTVHVADGVYSGGITIGKPIYLDGAGSGGTTHLVGSGSGNGILVTASADGSTIEGFAISNFGFGMFLDGRLANPLNGITVTNNVISGCATGAFTATFVNDGVVADNAFRDCAGFGADLNAGNRNRIRNNHIFEVGGFGLRVTGVAGSASDNVVELNRVHGIAFDGIRIGSNTLNTSVLSNTIMSTNRSTGGGFDLGGLALNGTTNVHVEGNVIAYVQNAGGLLPDAAGIGLDGSNVGPVILRNWIRDNVNHGIYLTSLGYTAGAPLQLHGNSIYANGKFGIYSNVTTVAADAEGNWWGHNSPTSSPSASTVPRDVFTGLGANVDYTPPIRLDIARAPTEIPADGVSTSSVTLTMRCATCTPVYDVLDNTVITLTNSLGSFGTPPVQRLTSSGRAYAALQSATVVGRSYITATTPFQSVYTWVDFVAGPAVTITLQANPPQIWPLGLEPPGFTSTATITVTAVDQFNNPCAGHTATFAFSPLGTASMSPLSRVLKPNGTHWTTLKAGTIAGTIWVTATVDGEEGVLGVDVMSGPPSSLVLERSPVAIPADGVSTAILTATVRDANGNLVNTGTMVGFETDLGSMLHDLVEAEGPEVDRSVGDWSPPTFNANASGNNFIYTDNPGAWVSWEFRGSAVSVMYRRGVGGGQARVFVDGDEKALIDLSAGSTMWRRETVVNGLNPSVLHTVRVECVTGRVWLDAIRSGATTVNGVATALLTSAQDCSTATVTATAVESRYEVGIGEVLIRQAEVEFLCTDLMISKVGYPEQIPPNELVTFTLYYTNAGATQGTAAVVTDTLPSLLTYVGSTSRPNVGPPQNPTDNIWVWSLGNLQPGVSGAITVTARHACEPFLGEVSNDAEIKSLTVEDQDGENLASKSVVLTAGPPFTMTITATPANILVDQSSAVRIVVYDACGNPVAGRVVNITTTIGSLNASDVVTNVTRTSDSHGRVNLTFYSQNSVGAARITATTAGVLAETTVWINVGPPAETVLVANPAAIPADGISTSTIVARVLDSGGYPSPDGYFVGFTTSLGSMIYGYAEESALTQQPPSSWTSTADGAASGGAYRMTSLDGASMYWNFHGNGVSIMYIRAPGDGWADVYLDGANLLGDINMGGSVTFRAERVFTWAGDPTEAHVLRITHRPGTGPIRIDAVRSGMTTSGGEAVAVLTAATHVGTAIVAGVTVSDTAGIVPVLIPGYVNVRFGPADLSVTKSIQPASSIEIGQWITFSLDIRNNGPMTATATTLDDLISDSVLSTDWLLDTWFSRAPLVISPGTNFWWSLGNMAPGEQLSIQFGGRINTARYWPAATVITNTATVDSSTADTAGANNVGRANATIVPSEPVTMTLYASPSFVYVGGDTSSLYATLRDVYGNPAPDGTMVTFFASLGGFPGSSVVTIPTSGGTAVATLTSGPSAGLADITASAGALHATTQVLIRPLGAFTMTLMAMPTAIPVGGSTSVIQANVVDMYGNWVEDGTAVSFATNAGFVSPAVDYTVSGGVTTILASGNSAVTATVTASCGAAVRTVNVRFLPGPGLVSIMAHPLVLPVGNSSQITVTARDEFGNPVLDGTVISLTTSLGWFKDSLITRTFTTTVGGRGVVGLYSTVAGRALVQAKVGANSAAVMITFEPGPPHTIRFRSVEPAIIDGCGGTGLATVVVEDRYGNPVKDGTVVVFDVTPQGDVEPIDGGRTLNGVAQAIISSGRVPGPATVWAWPENWRNSVVGTYAITFLVGPPDRIEANAEPPRVPVGGNNAAIRIRVFDCGNYPVTDGTVVTFTLLSGGGSLTPRTTTTANGRAVATLTSPNETGSASVRIEAGARQATVVVEYVPGPVFDILVTANPLSIAANGVTTSTVEAELRDRYGNYVADRTAVVFSTDLGSFPGGGAFTTATIGGRARAILTSSAIPGMARVAATAGGKRGEAFVDFYYQPTPTPTLPPQRIWKTSLPVILKWR
ncbi:MAG: Bacterial Ig-like domain (group 1) [Chloroflexi bacterium ADurb.Bin180]|nr:MAG: Bacterial Ig-like domain (group 1) [Chloroflexi bacterium ADurb.Bin180]